MEAGRIDQGFMEGIPEDPEETTIDLERRMTQGLATSLDHDDLNSRRVRHVTGWALWRQQVQALLVKNALLAWRNRTATFMQLFSSLFFIVILFGLKGAVETFESTASLTNGGSPKSPNATPIPAIPPCDRGYFMKADCYDFLWTGNQSAIVADVVRNISRFNPGRPIDFTTKTLGFRNADEVDAWLNVNPFRTTGVLHFNFTTKQDANDNEVKVLGYGVQTNGTTVMVREVYEDPVRKYHLPLQTAAERALARYTTKNWELEWAPSVVPFGYPNVTPQNLVAFCTIVFLYAAACFNFVVQMGNLLQEKELKLRQAMNVMGLMDSVHWLTWSLWEGGMAAVSVALLLCFGVIFRLPVFTVNSAGVLFVFFWLFWLTMTSVSFFFSTLLQKASSANSIGFFIFVLGGCLQLLITFDFPFLNISFPYNKTFPTFFQVLFSFFPPDMMAMGLKFLNEASVSVNGGMTWQTVAQCSERNPECVLTMAGVLAFLAGELVFFMLLSMYLDKVLPDANGQRLSLLFFLNPSFWYPDYARKGVAHPEDVGSLAGAKSGTSLNARSRSFGRGSGRIFPNALSPSNISSASSSSNNTPSDSPRLTGKGLTPRRASGAKLGGAMGIDPDVAEEERRVREHMEKGRKGGAAAVSVRGLVKTMKNSRGKGTFNAIDAPWYEVEKETLLCLLGPNGAGKSTTINCLTGVISATAGDGMIYGQSIRNPAHMAAIRRTMGVCPQFDVLWDHLSGIEHLFLFARVKGLHPQDIAREASSLLEEVRLTPSAKVRARSYSGGMRRRLSVAVALIGNPSVVFLDEPTTGMDPVSRRHVWDIIERAKRGRAIVLTTHSMEEADILGDRIAIMAKGRLRCIGTSIRLKERFGSGIIVTVKVNAEAQMAAQSAALDAPGAVQMSTDVVHLVQTGSVVEGGTDTPAHRAIMQFFRERLGVEPESAERNWVRYCLQNHNTNPGAKKALAPKAGKDGVAPTDLASFFRELSKSQGELGISGLQLSLTTLEEVFLNIVRLAELEAPSGVVRYRSILLPSGVIVQIPVGADKVHFGHTNPTTPNSAKGRLGGMLSGTHTPKARSGASTPASPMVMDVKWRMDERGNLCISGHSQPTETEDEMELNDAYEARTEDVASSPMALRDEDPDYSWTCSFTLSLNCCKGTQEDTLQ